MLNEFFINSLVDNLKLLEKQSIKLKDDKIISQNNMSKEEIDFINNKLDNDIELLSNLNGNKINDNDLNIFVSSLEFKKLEKNISNIFTLLNSDIAFYDNKIKNTLTNNEKSYDYLSNKLIKDEIKKFEINLCLKDVDLFKNKNKEIDNLVKLIDLKDLGLLSSKKIEEAINNKTQIDDYYTDNEIKIMSEMSKYLISDASENMEAMEAILVSGRFSSSTEKQLLLKAGYSENSFNQYLRGTNSINSVDKFIDISRRPYRAMRSQHCHGNCHSSCHGARGWR